MAKVDKLYNEYTHVKNKIAPPQVAPSDLREVIESAWSNGEPVKVLTRFKANSVWYEVGDDFVPEYKKDIPKLLRLLNANKTYFVPKDIAHSGAIRARTKELDASIRHDYSLLTKARNQVKVAKQEVENALAVVEGHRSGLKRSEGQVKKYSQAITEQIEGIDLDALLKEFEYPDYLHKEPS